MAKTENNPDGVFQVTIHFPILQQTYRLRLYVGVTQETVLTQATAQATALLAEQPPYSRFVGQPWELQITEITTEILGKWPHYQDFQNWRQLLKEQPDIAEICNLLLFHMNKSAAIPWRWVHAKVSHLDDYQRPILDGEDYLLQDMGFGSGHKLSLISAIEFWEWLDFTPEALSELRAEYECACGGMIRNNAEE